MKTKTRAVVSMEMDHIQPFQNLHTSGQPHIHFFAPRFLLSQISIIKSIILFPFLLHKDRIVALISQMCRLGQSEKV
jgi:hypothetical protein